ncbi:MAG: family transcriptional regulator [Phenylobacterium sp.]|jgi:transcriptional regulator with XRE-family HTH domain|nr:family transcriptional regulator [Phenylobacterium sp.]
MSTHGDKKADEIDTAVGARLRIRRQALGLSQTALAEKLGISFQQVQKYERGSNRISASTLVRAAQALDCHASELLGYEQDGAGDAELLSLMAAHGAMELLRAFNQIPDSETRAAVIAIARGLSGGAAGRHTGKP